MTGWLGDWANLLLRWTHFIAGIAWIGSSFYFIWLDRALTQPAQSRAGVEGDLWMVHSGGFYQVEKRRPAPGEIPPVLHWFKYEALLTWITGISLLVLLYYLSDAYLLDPGVSQIGRAAAIGLGAGLGSGKDWRDLLRRRLDAAFGGRADYSRGFHFAAAAGKHRTPGWRNFGATRAREYPRLDRYSHAL